VHVARTKGAAFDVAKLVEHDQWVVTGTGEMIVVGAALLVATGRAFRRIHVKDDQLRRLTSMYAVDPSARENDQRGEVARARQPFRLETAHLAGRRRIPIETARVHDGPHRRVGRKPLGVVHVLVSGQPSEHRLPKQPLDHVADVLVASRLDQDRSGHAGQSERVIQFAIGEQSGIPGDLAAVKFQLQATVEIDPKMRPSGFTRWVIRVLLVVIMVLP
jgi:hypothetical protein